MTAIPPAAGDVSNLRVYEWRAGAAAYARVWRSWDAKVWVGFAASTPGEITRWVEGRGVRQAPLAVMGRCDARRIDLPAIVEPRCHRSHVAVLSGAQNAQRQRRASARLAFAARLEV